MKVIVTFSGGKDSLASLLWVRNNLTKDFITVFCDTAWEHPLTYQYIEEICRQLDLNFVTIKSKSLMEWLAWHKRSLVGRLRNDGSARLN